MRLVPDAELAVCADCKKPLGKQRQQSLPGVDVDELCIQCHTNRRAKWMLKALPADDESQWWRLSPWEREFVTSVREQFARRGSLTEKQYLRVEELYRKLG